MSGPLPPDASSEQPADLLGRTIGGKFLIEAILGSGAMGVVYRARQTGLDKVVAIKVMHTGLAFDKTFAARFHREAKAASRLDHPNSIRVLDFGQEPDGLLYIAMDYLDGRDLLDVINAEWPLSVARMVDILSQALSALAIAHDLGILHRDLKPENIMVLQVKGDDGRPADLIKVCDFGIAKIIEKSTEDGEKPERGKLSTAGIVVGTPAYMSPEQAKGGVVDARSDIYAMGIILYQMLTMRVPFDAPTALSTLLRLLNEEPQAPSVLSSRVDPKLEAVCLKAMAKKPEDRYQSAREMRSALRAIVGLDMQSKSTLVGATPWASEAAVHHALQTSPTTDIAAPELDLAPRSSGRGRRWAWGIGVAVIAIAAGVLASRMRAPSVVEPSVLAPSAPAAPTGMRLEPGTAATAIGKPASGGPFVEARPVEPAAGKPRRGRHSRDTDRPAPDRQANENPSAPPSLAPTEPPVAPAPIAVAPASPARTPTSAPPGPVTPSPDPPSADPSNAHVEVGSATSVVGTTAANVSKAIAPVAGKLNSCYREALTAGTRNDGPATMHLETNEDGVITDVRLNARVAPSIGSCFAATLRGRKIPNVDTGHASADVPLVFKR